jgi:hypothetical protein
MELRLHTIKGGGLRRKTLFALMTLAVVGLAVLSVARYNHRIVVDFQIEEVIKDGDQYQVRYAITNKGSFAILYRLEYLSALSVKDTGESVTHTQSLGGAHPIMIRIDPHKEHTGELLYPKEFRELMLEAGISEIRVREARWFELWRALQVWRPALLKAGILRYGDVQIGRDPEMQVHVETPPYPAHQVRQARSGRR